jgi:hypothetical protein
MTFAIPLQVHVIWHPKDDSHCRPIVERLRTALTRDSYQPLVPGIGIPVFYRCAGAIPGEVNGVPRSIQMPDTLNDLRIALVTAELEDDPGWHRYLAESIAETKAKSPHAATIRVALSAAVAGGADLSGATIKMRIRIASSVDVPRRGCHCLTRMFPVVSSECSQMSSSSIHWERQSLR